MEAKRAVVVGASSGIGRELVRVLAREGYAVGMASRRIDLLNALQKELPGSSFVKRLDVARPEESISLFKELVDEMGGLDLLIISAGTGFINPALEWSRERQTVEVNVLGFTALAVTAMNYFLNRGRGHLVGISSIAALRGGSRTLAYNASKAFMSNYLEGLRFKAAKVKADITVTDIQPGFVDTDMAQGEGLFWVAPAVKAAEQIYSAIRHKRHHAYVTKRWALVAGLLKMMPAGIGERIL